jgi:uncharacterized protein
VGSRADGSTRAFALAAAALMLGGVAAPLARADFTAAVVGPLHFQAAAVGEAPDGTLAGTLVDMYVSLSLAPSGSGGSVFLDTRPLMEVDMQGSAREAALVAASVAGISPSKYDIFYSVRSQSQVIGGPSAGAFLTVATLALMTNHTSQFRNDVVLTGTILPDGSVGPVGGIPQKAQAAAAAGKHLFLYPAGQEIIPTSNGYVDLTTYCRDQLAITCQPVSTVEDAFAIIAQEKIVHAFPGVPLGGNESQAILEPGAAQLLSNATALARSAGQAFVGLGIPPNASAAVGAARNASRSDMTAARAASNASHFYTTATDAFQSSVESQALLYYAGWIQSGESPAFVRQTIAHAQTVAQSTESAAASRAPLTMAQTEALGAAQVRGQQALDLVAEAMNATSPLEALHDAAFAVQRDNTVTWWLTVSQSFLSGPRTNESAVALAATASIGSATDTIAYAKAIAASEGLGNLPTQEADQLLATANRQEGNELPAAALFNALEADVRAGLLIEATSSVSGNITNDSLNHAAEAALGGIVDSRAEGVEPIVALSYLELANSVRNQTPPDPADAYIFYGLARLTARLPDAFTLNSTPLGETRYAPFVENVPELQAPAVWLPATFAIGTVLGVLVSIAVFSRTRHRQL